MRMPRFSMLGLALAAGAVDALSFLALGQVFTANMTGNVVLLGLALGYGRTAHVMASGLAFAGFCAGLAAGFLLVGRGPAAARRGARPPHWAWSWCCWPGSPWGGGPCRCPGRCSSRRRRWRWGCRARSRGGPAGPGCPRRT
ncbi:DUF1275 family protein [Nonomuraea rubra]|uniref:DUF1275 family protein n=1 Tax=Nonomuraea rubra TaxID=46180 RepID=UPI003619259F